MGLRWHVVAPATVLRVFLTVPPNALSSPFSPPFFLSFPLSSRLWDTAPEEVTVTLRDPQLDGDTLTYKVDILDGALPASSGPCSLFIDPVGRPLSPVSVAGMRRRQRRRF